MKRFVVGIVGLGYVGGAIKHAYDKLNVRVNTYDIDPKINTTCNSLNELKYKSDLIYVCVPTPMDKAGECKTDIVESVIKELSEETEGKIIVIKSTVIPGTTARLQKTFPNQVILFSPEFLTEARYLHDYLNQDIMLVGAVLTDKTKPVAERVLTEQISTVESVGYHLVLDATTAELYKYTANVFLATKVSFANEMASMANKLDVDWNVIQHLIVQDSRMGKSHWKVPGPDGHFGFGGTCFPKDISALRNFAEKHNIPTPIIDAVWNRNVSIDRPEKDWETLKGRAVSE